MLAGLAVAHPANVPSALLKVQLDGSVELHVRCDVLAFCLEETPQEITDGPMNALLDGPPSVLTDRLADASNRLRSGAQIVANNGPAVIVSIQYPDADQVEACAKENGAQRLPVMLTAILKAKLPAGAKTVACRFPDYMGDVVLTTEMPYEEPVSEPVDAGELSSALAIPSTGQVSTAARSMSVAKTDGVAPDTKPAFALKHQEEGSNKPNRAAGPQGNQAEAGSPPRTSFVLSKAKDLTVDSSHVASAGANSSEPKTRAAGADRQAKTITDEEETANDASARKEGKTAAAPRHESSVVAASQAAAEVEPAAERADSIPLPATTPTGRPAWYLMFFKFVRMGYKHILPEGLDHILFVLGLFLLSRKAKPLLTQISAFTVAHSLTLGLSLYGVFQLPSSIVEPLIALSIVFVAVENIFTTEMKAWRPLVVFGFGLVHGLGFAGALKDAGLARGDFLTGLVGFNSGVELGQLSVVALAFLAVGWWRSSPRYRACVVMPASIAIAAVALFWAIQRVGLI